MMNDPPRKLILCNGAQKDISHNKPLYLSYFPISNDSPNVYLGLPKFVRSVNYLPDKILDLLEIASYIFAADRLTSRGPKDAVEYQSWSRRLKFCIKVRECDFWNNPSLKASLINVLKFMSGDAEFDFEFQPGHSTSPTSLFDREECRLKLKGPNSTILFSGGIDSLTGTIDRLSNTNDKVCLISHQTQPGTKRTQNSLVSALENHYPNRVFHYRFGTNLRFIRAREESQRTRSFLYTSIAFAISQTLSEDKIYLYENGITSLNFSRRQDLINARASRTTHPKTIELLQEFFSHFSDRSFKIESPFIWKTKTEIIEKLIQNEHPELITSSVSCSKTFQKLGQATHCGGCFQCIDRRIAAYASSAEDLDHAGLYAKNIIIDPIEDGEIKTTAIDYIRQAKNFNLWNADHFHTEMLNELSFLPNLLPGCKNELEMVESIFEMCKRHGKQVHTALIRMRQIHDDPYHSLQNRSLLDLVFSNREHLKEPVERLVCCLIEKLSETIPHMFQNKKPVDEPDLNRKINAIIRSFRNDLRSEYPTVSFACASVIPDHELQDSDVLIEAKYIRGNTPPSKASDGMAADLTKYPADKHILFAVYDPYQAVRDRKVFKNDFESKGNCTVCII